MSSQRPVVNQYYLQRTKLQFTLVLVEVASYVLISLPWHACMHTYLTLHAWFITI